MIFSSTQNPKPHPLDTFIEKYGAWEDERTAEEIVQEIYDRRTISNYDRANEGQRSTVPILHKFLKLWLYILG